MRNLANKLFVENSLVKLLKGSLDAHVGYVYSMDYTSALILTNDAWKNRVDGIPHNSFLIASALDPDRFAESSSIDQEVILLRVLNAEALPHDADLTRTKIEHHQRRVSVAAEGDNYDPLTAVEMQYGGLKCRILGTFFLESGSGQLRFGSDIENFMASSKLAVFKPRPDSLEIIVNHVNPEILKKTEEDLRAAGFKQPLLPLEIGTVRYTSSNRMQKLANQDSVRVKIHPADFLARRTAVLGMTRTGKSNTVKTTITAVANMATQSTPIGQLIFDINGEYANANHQDDGSSIAELFRDKCVRYRGLIREGDDRFRDLRMNFYLQVGEALIMIKELIRAEGSSKPSDDVKNFLESDLEEPDVTERGEHNRWQLLKAIFQCIIYKAGFKIPVGLNISFPISKDNYAALNLDASFPKPANKILTLDVERACLLFIKMRDVNYEQKKANNIGLKSSSGVAWLNETAVSYLNMLAKKNRAGTYIKGFGILTPYKDYHSPIRTSDVISEIIDLLDKGKIVILDLSVGGASVRKTLAERLARQVFEKGMNDMHNGKAPANIVLYIEEAHNLIGKDEALDNTWPRIAKEGAKARIALVYATQEPSSIHKNILANTENWFVCHLNNDDEIRSLSKFYDFGDFAASLKTVQDVGFARVKTLSSPFVVPVQIHKFSPARVRRDDNAL